MTEKTTAATKRLWASNLPAYEAVAEALAGPAPRRWETTYARKLPGRNRFKRDALRMVVIFDDCS